MTRSTLRILLAASFLSAATAGSLAAQARPSPLAIWFRQPATEWNRALPVGNGRLGAMVFGGTAVEHLQLNEETLWTGGPYNPVVKGAAGALPEIRRLLFAGDVPRAHDLFGRTMMGRPFEQMKYQPLGDLLLTFPQHDSITAYRRTLVLDSALARVTYESRGVRYTREVFASAPDQAIVMRLTASRAGALSFSATLHGVRNPAHSNYGTDYFRMDGVAPAALRLTGKNSDYLGITGRLTYEAQLRARTANARGTVAVDYRTLQVRDADTVTIVLAAATSFVNYHDVSGNPAERVRTVLDRATDRSWGAMLHDHVTEHQRWFNRVQLELGAAAPEVTALPTDERVARFAGAPDPALAALLYQFGRYLLIGSSRPGTQAANLQGIWNDNPNPWWDAKYTININLPMNYWPAETGNLGELVEPLESLVRDVSQTGAETAREHWGARGWVLHQNTDLWRAAAPMDGPSWGAWPVGGAWLMTNLYERYRFSADTADLRRMYPLLRDQVRFLLDVLVPHPRTGWLVTAPSNSPENYPAWPGNGEFFDETSGITLTARTMAAGPTMDMHIIRDLLGAFADAATTLGTDAPLVAESRAARARLAPNQVGRHGQLQEWLEDWEDLEPQHRHLSGLWGLYPGSEITPEGTPALAAAAAVTLDRRGTGGCGWSYAWKMGLRARLRDGEASLAQLRALLTKSSLPTLFSLCGRALQVDGNLGATAAIAEMLVQSHQDVIRLLPALPAEWSEGRVRGLRARGGFTIDVTWAGGRVTTASVLAGVTRRCRIAAGAGTTVTADGQRVRITRVDAGTIEFAASAGRRYEVRAAARLTAPGAASVPGQTSRR
ncbi:MAG: glycoside hydrolase family 95 protein [Gemmatimonadaceae bacterium]|nr:glycoside hydrolase family 95 protein [Gemmatimonadaceae bacterium]